MGKIGILMERVVVMKIVGQDWWNHCVGYQLWLFFDPVCLAVRLEVGGDSVKSAQEKGIFGESQIILQLGFDNKNVVECDDRFRMKILKLNKAHEQ